MRKIPDQHPHVFSDLTEGLTESEFEFIRICTQLNIIILTVLSSEPQS